MGDHSHQQNQPQIPNTIKKMTLRQSTIPSQSPQTTPSALFSRVVQVHRKQIRLTSVVWEFVVKTKEGNEILKWFFKYKFKFSSNSSTGTIKKHLNMHGLFFED